MIFSVSAGMAKDDKIDGIEVIKVFAGSQSEAIGIEIGDIIVEYNGEPVRTPQELYNQILKNSNREKIEMVVYRGPKKLIFAVKGGTLGLGVKYVKEKAD